MNFNGFNNDDFNVFKVEGLDQRMDAIQDRIRPKLEILGNHFYPYLSTICNEEIFYHVAKHARRTVNPPKDTWVAFAADKRGYKKHPHFQIGLYESHLFVWFAVIYESPIKSKYATTLKEHLSELQQNIPNHFVWSGDHTKPESLLHEQIKNNELPKLIDRLQGVKKAEILCGLNIERTDAIVNDGPRLMAAIEDCFNTLLPLYQLAKQSY